jgi:threonyl-tRNA synthetase
VYTPELGKRQLYERSGHWQHYEEDMYPPMRVGGDQVVLRPMNCPHHILVFDAEPRSLRAMPVRLAELGTMFRLERSGVVGGLSRVRQMTLNDGHVFCAMEHIGDEIASILGMVAEAYRALAIPPPRPRLSLRGEGPKYAGDGAAWELSEAMLRRSLDDQGVAYDEASDEAAFYGPKIDLQVTDPQGREETLSTVQVDFYLPGRFDLSFRRGKRSERPVMIHRSIVSTMERMVAHVLEAHGGALPPWLAPTQVVVVPVAEDALDHARTVRQRLHERDVRVELDDRDATLASRIRDAQQRHVPYAAVVGRREAESDSVAVRLRDSTRLDPRPVDAFLGLLDGVIATRTADLLPAGGAW